MKIQIRGEYLDMPRNFTADIEELSPIFNDRGTQSLPITIPAKPHNLRLLDFPMRADCSRTPGQGVDMAIVEYGATQRTGALNVLSASPTAGIELNIGFDNSIAYAEWKNKKLRELSSANTTYISGGVETVLSSLFSTYASGDPQRCPVAVFPIIIDKAEHNGRTYWELLNTPEKNDVAGLYSGWAQPGTLERVIDSTLTQVTVPSGYGVSPFLRVWKVLDIIFSDLRLKVVDNMFQSDIELSRLVILNNTADTCCTGSVSYSDLMPDCTVEEFLNALWVRFGLTYQINYDDGSVRLKLMRDIITGYPGLDITRYITDRGLITFGTPKYLKLSAQTSIEGAAPVMERFEDFVKGTDLNRVAIGDDVESWTTLLGQDKIVWDGDDHDEWSQWEDYDPEDPGYPDPPDPNYDDNREPPDPNYDDNREPPEEEYMRGRIGSALTHDNINPTIAREYQTSNWYRLDSNNGVVKKSSTPFFKWDPQTVGMEAVELSSIDEWVPMTRPAKEILWGDNLFPDFRVGARHQHTYVKGNDTDTEADGEDCPLAFMLAFTAGGSTVGRYCSETSTGEPYKMDDGTFPRMSLLFQFADGLFARFWKGYDEILRHAVRSVKVTAWCSRYELPGADMLTPVRFCGQSCLIDSINYSIGDLASVSADYEMRLLTTQGNYDIDREQNIPKISHGTRHLAWFLKSEDDLVHIGELETNRMAAANAYIQQTHYISRNDWPDGQPDIDENRYNLWTVDAHGAVPVGVERTGYTWSDDPSLPDHRYPGQSLERSYYAIATYDIYETHYLPGHLEWKLEGTCLGRVTVRVGYSVKLVARWVYD